MSALGVTPARVLRSEWIKLTTLRSMTITFAAAIATMIAGAILASYHEVDRYATITPAARADVQVADVVLVGHSLAELAIGVIGVMVITGEYATGMIRATIAAVPRRLPVLWVKLGLFAGLTFVVMTATSFLSFFVGNAILSVHYDFSLSDPGVLRQLVGVGVELTFVGALGVLLGFVIRNTAGAITALFAILMIVPLFLPHVVPGVEQYLPTTATTSLVSAKIEDHMLRPLPAVALLCAYLAVALAGAVWTLRRRDA